MESQHPRGRFVDDADVNFASGAVGSKEAGAQVEVAEGRGKLRNRVRDAAGVDEDKG